MLLDIKQLPLILGNNIGDFKDLTKYAGIVNNFTFDNDNIKGDVYLYETQTGKILKNLIKNNSAIGFGLFSTVKMNKNNVVGKILKICGVHTYFVAEDK